MSANQHFGSSIEDFLKEEGIYDEATFHAIKLVLTWQIEEAMKEHHSLSRRPCSLPSAASTTEERSAMLHRMHSPIGGCLSRRNALCALRARSPLQRCKNRAALQWIKSDA